MGAPPLAGPQPRALGLLGPGPFRLLFWAGVGSNAGFALAEVGLIWIVFRATASAWDIAFYVLSGPIAAPSRSASSVKGGACAG